MPPQNSQHCSQFRTVSLSTLPVTLFTYPAIETSDKASMNNIESNHPFLAKAERRSTTIERKNCYKPWAFSTSTLVLLLIFTLGMLGMIEFAFYALPESDSHGIIEQHVEEVTVMKRDYYVTTITTTSVLVSLLDYI
jgi:hypothetical protein